MAVQAGRWRAQVEGDVVVFLIGTRINKPWAVHRWLPVLTAMPPMVREALADPSVGMLANSWGWMYGQFTLVQHWRSFEHLERYARDPEAHHLPAWRRYNQAWRGNEAVGVYHETYEVRAGAYETMYVDEPLMGFAKAGASVPVGSAHTTAAQRLQRRTEDTPPVQVG